jgi:predicted dehydrogenase
MKERSSMDKRHLLVVGAGSVGKRHLRNLSGLGCQLSAVDPRPDRLDEANKETPLHRMFADLQDAFGGSAAYDGVVICSPPSCHVKQSVMALERELPVFLEKPVSPDAASAFRLAEVAGRSRAPLLLGYTYRWWPPVIDLRRRILRGDIGQPLHVRFVLSAHLADWHPWERYQDFFMSSRALGGGALLDESHFLDLLLWFFGRPAAVFARIERLSELEIETDDNVDAWFSFPSGARASLHLDLYGRPHERSIVIVGEAGTLYWRNEENSLRLGRSGDLAWEETQYTCQRNDMFEACIREFLEVISGERSPSCTIDDGVAVLQVIEAMRQSASEGKIVPVEPTNA